MEFKDQLFFGLFRLSNQPFLFDTLTLPHQLPQYPILHSKRIPSPQFFQHFACLSSQYPALPHLLQSFTMSVQNEVIPLEQRNVKPLDPIGKPTKNYGTFYQLQSPEKPDEEDDANDIDYSKKKRKQEKKKERKRKLKQEKAKFEEEKLAEFKEIMRRIYQENDTYTKYEKELREINEYIDLGKVFLNLLNSVIAGYVEKNLSLMDREFDQCLKQSGLVESDSIKSYENLLANRPVLFKKLTDCLYYKFIDICRAGTNVHMILKQLDIQFKEDRTDYDYQQLDYDIFQYLTENHDQFKNVVLYAFKALVKKSKPLQGVNEQSINRMMQIFKAMRLPIDDQSDDEQYSDHSTQQQDMKSSQKKRRNRRKNRRKKNKAENPENLICSQDLLQYLSPQEITRRLIQSLNPCEYRVNVKLDALFINSLRESAM